MCRRSQELLNKIYYEQANLKEDGVSVIKIISDEPNKEIEMDNDDSMIKVNDEPIEIIIDADPISMIKTNNCSKCDKYFQKISDLNRHIMDTHNHSRYKCLICTKTFTQLTLRDRHMKQYHPDEMTKNVLKEFYQNSFEQNVVVPKNRYKIRQNSIKRKRNELPDHP